MYSTIAVDSCRHSSTHTQLHTCTHTNTCTHIHTYTHSKREVYALTVYTVAPAMGSVFIVDALRAFSSLPPSTFPHSLGISILIQANRASHTHTLTYTHRSTQACWVVCVFFAVTAVVVAAALWLQQVRIAPRTQWNKL